MKNLSFNLALGYLKEGNRICRSGWNGKGMWLAHGKGGIVAADDFWNEHTKAYAESIGGVAKVDDYIIMKTAAGTICMGWLASQADLLADDWEVL